MANVVVVGSQWGDEGKGKIVDWLSERADVVVRFQGGHNAGHTLVVDGKVYKLSLLPSGVVRQGKLSIIGNGVVFDPHAFVAEAAKLKAQGVEVTPDRLKIAENTALILSVHRELDGFREDAASNSGTKIGTTRRGIGPAYEDKVGRRAVRVMDLADLETLPLKVDRLLTHHNALRRGLGHAEVTHEAIMTELTSVADEILPYMDRVWKILDDKRRAGERILFEGAQGTLLDIDHGTYPFVTSSNCVAGAAAAGAGVGPQMLHYVLGITKAYTTRVGSGPFPTELDDDIGEQLRTRGKEFGSVTGRPRRCGWFDAAALKRSVQINGVSGLCITKLDVLDGVEALQVGVGYNLRGERIDILPSGADASAGCEPIYEEIPGWTQTTVGITRYGDLPANARNYLKRIEQACGVPIDMISTGPDRDETIVLRHPFDPA